MCLHILAVLGIAASIFIGVVLALSVLSAAVWFIQILMEDDDEN